MTTDILLIAAPNPEKYEHLYPPEKVENSVPPLGLAYLASMLQQFEYSVAIEDLHIERFRERSLDRRVKELIQKHSPRIVGITTTTPTYWNGTRIARAIRDSNPSIKLVTGGIHSTFLPEEALRDGYDIVVRGEGELTIVEIMDAVLRSKGALKTILGISFQENGEIKHNPPRPLTEDINRFQFPARELLDMRRYIQKGAIISSRGCTAKCNFCSCRTMDSINREPIQKNNYRPRQPQVVVEEMKRLYEAYGTRQFFFQDDIFTDDEKRVASICDLIRKWFIDNGIGISWGAQSRINKMTPELAEMMSRAGCKTIQYGVESGSQNVLDRMHKGIRLEQVPRAVRYAVKAGIEYTVCGFIIGHYCDTVDTVFETFELMGKLIEIGPKVRTPVSILTPFPGTPVYYNKDKLGVKILREGGQNWEEYQFFNVNIETENLNQENLRLLHTIGMNMNVQYREKLYPAQPSP